MRPRRPVNTRERRRPRRGEDGENDAAQLIPLESQGLSGCGPCSIANQKHLFALSTSWRLVVPSPAVAAWAIGAVLLGVRATATEVQGELLRLLARVGIDNRLAYRHPAVVAGVG